MQTAAYCEMISCHKSLKFILLPTQVLPITVYQGIFLSNCVSYGSGLVRCHLCQALLPSPSLYGTCVVAQATWQGWEWDLERGFHAFPLPQSPEFCLQWDIAYFWCWISLKEVLGNPWDKQAPNITVRRIVLCRAGSWLDGEANFCTDALQCLAYLGGSARRIMGQTQCFFWKKQRLLALNMRIRSKICVQTCSCCPSLEPYSHPNKQHMGNLGLLFAKKAKIAKF